MSLAFCKMEIKPVKRQARLHKPTKWTRKNGGLVKVKSEPDQPGYGEESEVNVTVDNDNGLISLQIKKEENDVELHETSDESSGGPSQHHHHPQVTLPLKDSEPSIISKSEQDQVDISPDAIKDEPIPEIKPELQETEIKRETELCVKDESDAKEEDIAQDIDTWMRAGDNGVSSAQFFPCPECTVSFTKWPSLERHMKWNHQKQYHALLKRRFSTSKSYLSPSLSCPRCGQTFHTPRQLTIHTHQAHPSAPPLRRHPCPTCARSFQYLGNLERHCKRWHKMAVKCTKGHLSCADCGKNFRTTWGQGPHRCDEPDDAAPTDGPVCLDTGVTCLECGKMMCSPQSLAVHMRTHTGERPCLCTQCGKRFSEGSALRKHMLIHTGVKSHECQACDKTFPTPAQLRSHMRTHTGEKPFACPECGRRFTHRSSLSSHLLIHLKQESVYRCSECDKAFSLQRNLNRHMTIHSKGHQCGECGLRVSTLGVLKTHVRTHSGERPYHCTVCQRRFVRLEHLKNHQRTHTGEKPYKCPECDKSFIQSGCLATHLRRHRGDRPYACSECDLSFHTSGELRGHSTLHSGVRPYTCKECGRGFRFSGQLKSHVRTHTGEKPYSCPRCLRRFARVHHLTGHLNSCT